MQHSFRSESFFFQRLRNGPLTAFLRGECMAGQDMEKSDWVVAYRSVRGESALKESCKLTVPSIRAGDGTSLIRTAEVEPRESGVNRRHAHTGTRANRQLRRLVRTALWCTAVYFLSVAAIDGQVGASMRDSQTAKQCTAATDKAICPF